MLKNVTKLEVKIDEKLYQLICDNESPIGHVKEALFQFMKIVAQVEDNIIAARKAEEEAKAQQVSEEAK